MMILPSMLVVQLLPSRLSQGWDWLWTSRFSELWEQHWDLGDERWRTWGMRSQILARCCFMGTPPCSYFPCPLSLNPYSIIPTAATTHATTQASLSYRLRSSPARHHLPDSSVNRFPLLVGDWLQCLSVAIKTASTTSQFYTFTAQHDTTRRAGANITFELATTRACSSRHAIAGW